MTFFYKYLKFQQFDADTFAIDVKQQGIFCHFWMKIDA